MDFLEMLILDWMNYKNGISLSVQHNLTQKTQEMFVT